MEPRSFPPDVFARLAPEIYFERFLEHGSRPTGRKFTEFRPLLVQQGRQSELAPSALGSAVVRAGQATVICGISGGLTDFENEGGVYANVEIHRGGRSGAPTAEEMVLTRRTHELILAAQIDPSNFKIDIPDSIEPCRKELVLNASIRVLSRTGPCLDLVWAALAAALNDTRIPLFTEDERTHNIIPTCERKPLVLPETLVSSVSTFGLLKSGEVLADPDGPTEEACISNYVNVAKTDNGLLTKFSLLCTDTTDGVDAEKIQEILSLAGRPVSTV